MTAKRTSLRISGDLVAAIEALNARTALPPSMLMRRLMRLGLQDVARRGPVALVELKEE